VASLCFCSGAFLKQIYKMLNNTKKRKEANITLPDSPLSATVQSFDLFPMVRHRMQSMSLEARRECQEIVCYLLPMLKADFMVHIY
jgi:hypothetical protein